MAKRLSYEKLDREIRIIIVLR